jgi:glycosyltransferase involved in cell wall biosynthesis
MKILNSERVDVVHTHLYDPTLLGLIIGKVSRRKVVVTRHHSDAVHNLTGASKRAFYLAGEYLVNGLADHIIAPSQMVYDTLVKRERVPAGKVSLIPYGQTAERFDNISGDDVRRVREELSLGDRLSIVCVSRLHKEKGHRYLLDAFGRLRKSGFEANLLLVGEGPHADELRSLTRQLGISNDVRFLGWRDDALSIIKACDIVVHPSLHEALPSVVIEALMLGKPLVVTDVSGVRDAVCDNQYGIIVPPADSEALRVAIESTARNLGASVERARGARAHLMEYMGAGRVANAYIDCYRRVMGRRPEGFQIDDRSLASNPSPR